MLILFPLPAVDTATEAAMAELLEELYKCSHKQLFGLFHAAYFLPRCQSSIATWSGCVWRSEDRAVGCARPPPFALTPIGGAASARSLGFLARF